ncbi:MAG: TraM recognition domain-containing protein, partial [Enterococcus sp.]|nr:TraM recognition domain-containing protein [Enterococcus sp.]
FVAGASGSGKTTTLLTGARDSIRRGEGFVFVDMKGSTDVPEILAAYAKRYGRRFYHWTSHDPRTAYNGPADCPAYYDPLGRGNATRRANLLLEGRDWSEDHYRIIIQDYLQKAFEIAEGVPPGEEVDALADIMTLLDPMALKKRTLPLVGDPYYDEIITEINYMTDKKIDKGVESTLDGMRRQLGILRDSIQGRWLRKDPEGTHDISIFDAAQRGDVVVFTLDSANYSANSALIGNLIIQDLMTVSSELRADPAPDPLNIIIDEFSAIGSDNIINLIARCRDSRMPVTLSTQSLGDLKAVSNEFMEQLTGIVSSFIVHRPNRYDDAEVYAGLVGKEKKQVFRQNVEHTSGIFGSIGKGAGTGKGSVEVEEDYKISPAQIQELGPGEMYYICKSPFRIEKVHVIAEDGKVVTKEDAPAPVVNTYKPSQTTTFIPEEERSKYRVDPSINGKPSLIKDGPVYGESNFEEDPNTPRVKKSDPDRLRAIMGRKSPEVFENSEGKFLDLSEPEVPVSRPNPISEYEPEIPEDTYDPYMEQAEVETPKKTLPKLPPKQGPKPPVKSSGGLPALPKSGLPALPKNRTAIPVKSSKASIDRLTSLPKVERTVPPRGARPIRPSQGKDISLPPIFPSPSDQQKFKPRQEPADEPTYGVGDWDDEF